MVEHVDIPDGERHEPKGAGSASAGQAYFSDGAGSGTWKNVSEASYLCMRRVTDVTTSGMSTSYKTIDNSTLGVTWSSSTESSDITVNLTAGEIIVANAGTYHIVISMVITGTEVADRHYAVTFGIDSGSGIVDQDGFAKTLRSTDNTTDTGSLGFACLPTLLAGDKLYLRIKIASGSTSEVEINQINFTMNKASE